MRYMARIFAALLLAACAAGTVVAQGPPTQHQWLAATPEKLPRWRGFNLLEKFMLSGGRKPFLEEDFRLISKLGFNFVRLPMDYRLLDQGRQLGGVRRGDAQGDRPGGRVGREVRNSRLDQLSPRPRLYGRQPAGENQPLDRPQDTARLRQALGHVRPPLPRHPQRASEL